MAHEERVSDWYLTQGGWVESNGQPANAVERWKRTSSRHLVTGKPQIAYVREWVDPQWSAEDVKILRESFPKPEGSISGKDADVSWELVD